MVFCIQFLEHPHELFLIKGVPHQFLSGWENLRSTSIKKFKYDLQTLIVIYSTGKSCLYIS